MELSIFIQSDNKNFLINTVTVKHKYSGNIYLPYTCYINNGEEKYFEI